MKAALLGADDVVIEKVPTPEWAAAGLPVVWLRSLSGTGRDRHDQVAREKKYPFDDHGRRLPADWGGLTADLLARMLCTETGELLGFNEAEVMLLGTKNGAALDRCFEVASRISGLGPNAVEQAEGN
jgi:hypothetical protein